MQGNMLDVSAATLSMFDNCCYLLLHELRKSVNHRLFEQQRQ